MKNRLFNRKNKEEDIVVISTIEVCDEEGTIIAEIESSINDEYKEAYEEVHEEMEGIFKRILKIKYENKKTVKKYAVEKESNDYKTYEDLLVELGIAEKMKSDPLYELTEDELINIEDEFMKRTGKDLMKLLEQIFNN